MKNRAGVRTKIDRLSFVRSFRGFGTATQAVFVLMFVGGVILCVSLWLTDLGIGFTEPHWLTRFNAEWLRSHSYIPNILAGLTGFLIGVPVALIVLETIRSDYAQKQQIDAVNRITSVAWRDFSDAIKVLCSNQRIKAAENTKDHSSPTDQVQAECKLIFETLEATRDLIREDRTSADIEIPKLRTFLVEHNEKLKIKYDAVTKQFGSEDEFRREWSYAVALWEVIDTHVRLRRIEFDLPKMNTKTYVRIRDYMTSPDNAVNDFFNVHSRTTQGSKIKSVRDLQITINVLLELSDSQIGSLLDGAWSEYFGTGILDYWSEAHSAGVFLQILDANILAVSLSEWISPPRDRPSS